MRLGTACPHRGMENFLNGPRKAGMETLGLFCSWCGIEIVGRGRGTGKRFCGELCRRACDKEAFRLGRRAIRAKQAMRISILPTDITEQRLAKFTAIVRELTPKLRRERNSMGETNGEKRAAAN